MKCNEGVWNFPKNNYGPVQGLNLSGVETFNGRTTENMARENVQNALDARAGDGPVIVEFHKFPMKTKDIPDFNGLFDAVKGSAAYQEKDGNEEAKKAFERMADLMKQKKIEVLRVSDSNTTGLRGSDQCYDSDFTRLVKSEGSSNKNVNCGGSYGIGSNASFACSDLRYSHYSTLDDEGVCANQGVAKLGSHEGPDGQRIATGFCGNPDKNTPIYEQASFDPDYNRTTPGTDIYIFGFNGGKRWKDKIIVSVLDSFLYAIYMGKLIVIVDDVVIDKEHLLALIASYGKNSREYLSEYFKVLTSKDTSEYVLDIENPAGQFRLQLAISPEFSRHVAMIRSGMKIKDQNGISSLVPFAGIMYVEGRELNSYLRKLEGPTHRDWEAGRANPREKENAKQLLASMKRFIKDSLFSMKGDAPEYIDALVGDYLSFDTGDSGKKSEIISDRIKSIQMQVEDTRPVLSKIPFKDDARSPKKTRGGRKEAGDKGPAERSQVQVSAIDVRSVVRNKDQGEYTLLFTPNVSGDNGVLELFMSAEDNRYPAEILSVSCKDCPDAVSSDNKIEHLTFTADKRMRVDVRINYYDICPLMVKAYVDRRNDK